MARRWHNLGAVPTRLDRAIYPYSGTNLYEFILSDDSQPSGGKIAQRNQAFTDFIQHSRCVNFYTGKQVLVAGQGNHYHVAGCEMIDDSNGPHLEADYHIYLANESGSQYVSCSCAFKQYQEALHSALIVKSVEC